eukprot:5576420-Ditylum_brightwellii.AAC.1
MEPSESELLDAIKKDLTQLPPSRLKPGMSWADAMQRHNTPTPPTPLPAKDTSCAIAETDVTLQKELENSKQSKTAYAKRQRNKKKERCQARCGPSQQEREDISSNLSGSSLSSSDE